MAFRCPRSGRVPSVATASLVLLLCGCGGSTKPSSARAPSPNGTVAGPQSLVDHLPPINDLPRLHPLDAPNVIVAPLQWAATNGIPGTPGDADATRLGRLGFVAGVQEQLASYGTTAGEVDAQVEQFRTTASANSELRYRLTQARASGRSPGYRFSRFAVGGVPGGAGYSVAQAGSSGDAIVFAAGPYFYLMQSMLPSGGSVIVTAAQMRAEAVAWYRHLRSL